MLSWRELAHPQWGGSEVLVDRIAQGFVARGWDVRLVCSGPVGERPYEVLPNGGRFTQYVRAPFLRRKLRDADVVIDVSNGIPFFSPLWLRRPTVCLVHHVHRDQWRDALPAPMAAFGWWLERRVVPRLYRRFWSVSPSTTAALGELGLDSRRIREVWNGVDTDGAPPDEPQPTCPPLFVVISRLVPHKGVDRVLDAWEVVGPRVGGELVIIGDGPLRAELEARRVERTRFAGAVADDMKWSLLHRSWLLVHGAHQEGWGIVVMEAAASGVPTLAFAVPGVRDAIVHGVTGVLAVDHEGLVAAWTELAENHELRRELGRKAWERASALSWDATVEGAAEMVEAIAGGSW